jgi:hypothetical protein
VLAVAQPDGAVAEGADVQPLAPEPVPGVEAVVVAVPASLLSVRVVRLEAEVASLAAATAPA